MKLEIPLRYVKLLPLQGALLIGITTQGAALGYELLPLQGVLVAWGLAFMLRAMDFGSGRAGCMGLAFVLRAMNIGSGSADIVASALTGGLKRLLS